MKFILSMINRIQIHFLLFILTGTLVGCGTTRPMVSPRDPVKQLRNDINAILSDTLFMPAHASIKVVSLDSGNMCSMNMRAKR
jgi:hypothetical protein